MSLLWKRGFKKSWSLVSKKSHFFLMVIEFSFPSLNLSELCLRALTRVEWHFPGLGKSLRNRILELPKKNSLIILSHLDFMSFNDSISNNYLSCRNFIAFHIPLQLFRTLAPTRTHALHHARVRPLPPMHTHTHTHEHTHTQFSLAR